MSVDVKFSSIVLDNGAVSVSAEVSSHEDGVQEKKGIDFVLPPDSPLFAIAAETGLLAKVRSVLVTSKAKKDALSAYDVISKLETQQAAFKEGNWNAVRTGNSAAPGNQLAQALTQMSIDKGTPKTFAEVTAYLEGLSTDPDTRRTIYAQIRQRADVIKAIANLKLAQASSRTPVDLSALGL